LRRHRPDVVLADLGKQEETSAFLFAEVVPGNRGAGANAAGPGKTYRLIPGFADLGVYDYILKPVHRLQPKLREVQGEILEKIRAVREPKYVSTFSYSRTYCFKATNRKPDLAQREWL
jgi:hypothetical protein